MRANPCIWQRVTGLSGLTWRPEACKIEARHAFADGPLKAGWKYCPYCGGWMEEKK